MAMGTAGFSLNAEMERILGQPGYISCAQGGQRLRELYQERAKGFNPNLYTRFARNVFFGIYDDVRRAVERGDAPDLTGTETPYRFGYITIAITGCVFNLTGPPASRYVDTLAFLLDAGAPPDVPDVVGYTALHHAAMNNAHCPNPVLLELMRALCRRGADPNARNRYGELPIMGALQHAHLDAIDILMEHGTDLAIPDADGTRPDPFYLRCGPEVAARVRRWLRERAGEEGLRAEKKCDSCGGRNTSLRQCARCHTVMYCSRECQRAHWPAHKAACRPFDAANTVTVTPYYKTGEGGFSHVLSTATLTRQAFGIPTPPTPAAHTRAGAAPSVRGAPKSLVVKVQVPFNSATGGPALTSSVSHMVYTKKRDFVCTIRKADDPAAYQRIFDVVVQRGVGGVKAYFPAELVSKDQLVIKVGDVLAEQPF